MRVYAIVVNYNNFADTRECIASLRSASVPPGMDFSILLVDNASSDGSSRALKAEFPDLVCIESESNLGYAGGNNLGIKRAMAEGADWVWLLNNDTVVDVNVLSHLAEAMRNLPEAGILGSVVYDYGTSDTVQFAGGRLNRCRGTGRRLSEKEISEAGVVVDCDFVTGASLVARNAMIKDVGMLDEAYYLYLEDLDWGLRAKRRGWKVYVVLDAKVWHKGNSTSARARPLITYYVARNSLYLCRKFMPAYFLPVVVNCFRLRVFNYLVKGLIEGFSSGELEYAKMGMRGIADFFRGELGGYRSV